VTRSSSVLWMDLTAEELRAKAATDTIVVLPVASIEQHGPHLPVGVDTILCSGVCKAAAERAGDIDVVVAPTLWCGMAEHHMAFGGTFTFDIPTYRAVLLSFLKSIERHGFHRVLIVNGHGGNIAALTAFLPDFARETRLHVEATTYFMLAQDAFPPLLEDQKGVQHACEVETSMMMVLAPGSVREPRLAEAFGALDRTPRRQVVSRHRSFREMTETGVVGDARRATPQKGQACLDACADALAGLLREMGRAA
jgi:creatinine amidohydrolase